MIMVVSLDDTDALIFPKWYNSETDTGTVAIKPLHL